MALLLSGIAAFAVGAAQLYDLHKDFTLEANPHHGWSAGYSKTVTGFQLFTTDKLVEQLYAPRGQGDLKGWSRKEEVFPYAARNQGTTILYQRWGPGQVVLSPSNDLYSIVRWTNAAPGTVTVHLYVTFRRVEDVTGFISEWNVVANGAVVDTGTITQGNEEKSVTETLEIGSGSTIALVVGCRGHMDGTELGVNAVIKPLSQ